jgi:hypothetical protein
MKNIPLSLLLLLAVPTTAFVSIPSTGHVSTTRLFGISEWRDFSSQTVDVLPVPSKSVLLPGEIKYLHLTDDSHLQLFQNSLENGIFGLGLLMHDNANILPILPLVEIQSYQRSHLGIFCQVQALSRAKWLDLTNQEGSLVATVEEQFDDNHSSIDYEVANDVADEIESLLMDLSSPSSPSWWDSYQVAYHSALSCDVQGYIVSTLQLRRRSWDQLTAMSWALTENVTLKLNALHQTTVLERLEWIRHWLSEVVRETQQESSQL